jgi:hypothetical protein
MLFDGKESRDELKQLASNPEMQTIIQRHLMVPETGDHVWYDYRTYGTGDRS